MQPLTHSSASPSAGSVTPAISRFKAYRAKGDWYIAEKHMDEWTTISGPYPSEQIAQRAIPGCAHKKAPG